MTDDRHRLAGGDVSPNMDTPVVQPGDARTEYLRSGGSDLRVLDTPGDGMTCGDLQVPNGTRLHVGHLYWLRTEDGRRVAANCTVHGAEYVRISRVPLDWLRPVLETA